MSRTISMANVMILLPLLFAVGQVRLDQSMVPLRSFTISGNVTYDCIDIYKQPGLDHHLLKNHRIQMNPSVSRHEPNNQIRNNNTYKEEINCPYGTVPIMRNTKEFNANAQLYAEKYSHTLSAESPGSHIAGVKSHNGPFRGIYAIFKGYSLKIGEDQASYSQVYLGSGYYGDVDYISAGLMINPSFFRDGRLWTFGFWKGKNGKSCYNTACPGFIQISHVVPIVQPIDIQLGDSIWLHWSVHEDEQTGNWWLIQNSPTEYIGYWPRGLFHLMGNGARMVGAGGFVQASSSGLSPPMGNGGFPYGKNFAQSAQFTNVDILDSKYVKHKISYAPLVELLDSTKCYGLNIGKRSPVTTGPLGYFFNYGGPGGFSCGV